MQGYNYVLLRLPTGPQSKQVTIEYRNPDPYLQTPFDLRAIAGWELKAWEPLQ